MTAAGGCVLPGAGDAEVPDFPSPLLALCSAAVALGMDVADLELSGAVPTLGGNPLIC